MRERPVPEGEELELTTPPPLVLFKLLLLPRVLGRLLESREKTDTLELWMLRTLLPVVKKLVVPLVLGKLNPEAFFLAPRKAREGEGRRPPPPCR